MKKNNGLRSWGWALLGTAFAVGASPAGAQDTSGADLDSAIDAASTPDGALRLARQQADGGDLIAAAATLERALLARPSGIVATQLGLAYVTTLCRLDDRVRAQVELAKIDGGKIGDTAWAEAQAACGAIERPLARGGSSSGVNGQLAIGVAYDSDALGALAVAFDLPGVTGVTDDDFSFIASGRIDGRVPFGQSYLYGGISGATKNAFGASGLDYQLGDVHFGYGRQTSRFGFSLGGIVQHIRLQGAPFATEYGGQAEILIPTGDRGRVAVRGLGVRQDYMRSSPTFSRDGARYDVAVDYQATTRKGAVWVVGAAFEDKTADTPYLGYRGARIFSAFREPIGSAGSYVALSSTIRWVDFRDSLLVADRKETRAFTRAAIGTPLGGSGFDIEAAVSHTGRYYNAASLLRDYNSFGVELRLIWSFGK